MAKDLLAPNTQTIVCNISHLKGDEVLREMTNSRTSIQNEPGTAHSARNQGRNERLPGSRLPRLCQSNLTNSKDYDCSALKNLKYVFSMNCISGQATCCWMSKGFSLWIISHSKWRRHDRSRISVVVFFFPTLHEIMSPHEDCQWLQT